MKVRELVTLGSLDPRRILWRLRPFVATWELPILLWVVPRIVVESRSGAPNPIVGCAPDCC